MKRNYKELWIGLKSAVLLSDKKVWKSEELTEAMTKLENSQRGPTRIKEDRPPLIFKDAGQDMDSLAERRGD